MSTPPIQESPAPSLTEEQLANVASLEEKIGYIFTEKHHAAHAMVHPSLTPGGNMVLAQMGDAVLRVVMTEDRYLRGRRGKGDVENDMSAALSGGNLANLAEDLGLKDLIQLGQGQNAPVGQKAMESFLEAVFGAVYLDTGIDGVRKVMQKIGLGIEDEANGKEQSQHV
ncbi:ribonuclease III [Atractiella rhizophila]|nr:ribonuclease III [Atractiella rhizophila]